MMKFKNREKVETVFLGPSGTPAPAIRRDFILISVVHSDGVWYNGFGAKNTPKSQKKQEVPS